MHRSLSLSLTWAAVACGAGLALAACEQRPQPTSPEAPAHSVHASTPNANVVSGDVERQIARLRALTAPFHAFQTAVNAGWGNQITGCMSDPQGGMGYHYGNPALIDGVVDALKPELLLYEPQKNGKLRFVAVEYIVPFTAWTGDAPPQLYGQSFHRNEGFGLWVLHVWHFNNNPRGMFTDWNPRVTCDYAAP